MAKSAHEIRDEFQAFLCRMADAFAEEPSLKEEETALRTIAGGATKPFTLAVFGRMKTGKSSLINALVGRPLAITGVEEATATLNWISYGEGDSEKSLMAHWRDGRTELLPFSRLMDWVGKDPQVLERVRATAFLELFSNAPPLKNIQIVDTPGTGSVAEEHEQIATEFLSPAAAGSEEEGRKADALLYVFPPVARERDENSLQEFRRSRLPGSDPYNSIGVLHKWDGLESDDIDGEAVNKAERIRETLEDFVCDVIPVSAPLALAARHSPDDFLEGVLDLLTRPGARDGLGKALRRDTRWDDDPERAKIRGSYSLPWVSFVRLVKILMESECASVGTARAVCLEKSGLPRLEAALDERFFKRAVLIKQRSSRAKADRPLAIGMMKWNARLTELSNDVRHWMELSASIPPGSLHERWITAKRSEAQNSRGRLEALALEADRHRIVEQEKMKELENDFAMLDALRFGQLPVEPRDRETIDNLLTAGTCPAAPAGSRVVLETMLHRYMQHTASPDRRIRCHFEHLVLRLQQHLS